MKARILQGVSPIFLSLQPLVVRKVKDWLELIIANLVPLSSLALTKSNSAFSTVRLWNLPEWLGISNRVSKIVPSSQYWQSFQSGFCLLDKWEKTIEGIVILPEWVFWEAMTSFSEKKIIGKRGILDV